MTGASLMIALLLVVTNCLSFTQNNGGFSPDTLLAALQANGIGTDGNAGIGIGVDGGVGIGIGGGAFNDQVSKSVGVGTNGANGLGMADILGNNFNQGISFGGGIGSDGLSPGISALVERVSSLQNGVDGIGIGIGGTSVYGKQGNGIGIGLGNPASPPYPGLVGDYYGGNGIAVGGSSIYANGGDGIGIGGTGVKGQYNSGQVAGAAGTALAVGGSSVYKNGGQGYAVGGSVKPAQGYGNTALVGGNSKALGGSSVYDNGGSAKAYGGPITIGSSNSVPTDTSGTGVSSTYVPGHTTRAPLCSGC